MVEISSSLSQYPAGMKSVFHPCLYSFSVAQSCPTPCDPMDCIKPGFPVLHYLPELAQTHVHCVGDAIQPSHPMTCLSLPAFFFFSVIGVFSQ